MLKLVATTRPASFVGRALNLLTRPGNEARWDCGNEDKVSINQPITSYFIVRHLVTSPLHIAITATNLVIPNRYM